jgi:uncharacterized protein YgiM (DUF1202 family)
MKGFVGIIMLVLSAAVILSAQTGNLYVKGPKDNIRMTPNGAVIGELQAGIKVNVLERRANWVRVQMSGWIPESSLTADSTMISGFTLRASHILVKTEVEANTVLQELKAGAAFEDLAKRVSVDKSSAQAGGDLGEFQRGDLMPAFETTVLRLKIGEISGAVRSPLGFHVIKRTK